MKIFITGGTGFIGGQLVKCLAQTEHELVCLARKTSDVSGLKEAGATIVFGDVIDKTSLRQGMQGCDWLVHLASNFTLWTTDRRVYKDVNIQGIRNIMESALETGISKVVHVSTAATFGNAQWPIQEESQPGTECASEYAQTKRAGDQIAWEMYREKGLPLVVIYPTAVVGANDPKAAGRYIKNLALRRMPAQILVNQTFPFVYVGDVCHAILNVLQKKNNLGEKYLVSSANMTWGELNRMVCEIAGVSVPFIHLPAPMVSLTARMLTSLSSLTKMPPWLDLSVDQVNIMKQGFMVDGSKAERELGVTYTPIRDALKEAVASFSSN